MTRICLHRIHKRRCCWDIFAEHHSPPWGLGKNRVESPTSEIAIGGLVHSLDKVSFRTEERSSKEALSQGCRPAGSSLPHPQCTVLSYSLVRRLSLPGITNPQPLSVHCHRNREVCHLKPWPRAYHQNLGQGLLLCLLTFFSLKACFYLVTF